MALTRVSRALGLFGVLTAIILIGLLHLIPPSSNVDAVTRTLSEYGLLPDAWVFNVGVTALALGSVAVVVSLVSQEVIRAVSVTSFLVAVWSASLMVIVAFPKNNWAVGPSMGGTVHRVASVVAFVALPLAAIIVGRITRSPWPLWLGVVSLLWFAVILGAVAAQPFTGIRWWLAIPLGVVERGMLLTEVLAVGSLVLVDRRSTARQDPVSSVG
ncbi:DUF998 domain-containing protein [Actinocrispum wychmicini]|uniref:Uncharacterized protein DUF998 n=1 Tax=Actinocrispum wychmicini TaxID=1213861 RepID=A0A4R2JEB4_9PSEU|nr:DUF998 domain-containing protein [Actinocrispum wychmicini]TCO55168.1 uncharacterized protein DUF998 [Actinocrispum wychmicini]